MTNAEKIQILKENIKHITNSKTVDENYIFNFAKQQAKEIKIEISKGEIKSIIYEILMLVKNRTEEFADDNLFGIQHQSYPNFLKEFEDEDPFIIQ